MDAAMSKCSVFMEEAMSCLPPKGKIEKYKSRLEKVFSNTRYFIKKRRCHRPGKKKGSKFTDKENIAEFESLEVKRFKNIVATI